MAQSNAAEAARVKEGCHQALRAAAALMPWALARAFSSRFLLACTNGKPVQRHAHVIGHQCCAGIPEPPEACSALACSMVLRHMEVANACSGGHDIVLEGVCGSEIASWLDQPSIYQIVDLLEIVMPVIEVGASQAKAEIRF